MDYEIRSSSHVGQHKPSEAILQFSDDPKFWNPDVNDPAPTLEVVFSSNRVMTALEVRGDSKFKDDHLKRAVLNYRKLVFSGTHTTQQVRGEGGGVRREEGEVFRGRVGSLPSLPATG